MRDARVQSRCQVTAAGTHHTDPRRDLTASSRHRPAPCCDGGTRNRRRDLASSSSSSSLSRRCLCCKVLCLEAWAGLFLPGAVDGRVKHVSDVATGDAFAFALSLALVLALASTPRLAPV